MVRSALSALIAAGVFASAAPADDPAPPQTHPIGPGPIVTPLPLLPLGEPGTLVVHSWRSDRIGGVVREHARFTFCSSLTPGPFKVSVVESRGFAHHAARAPGAPRFVQRGRFALRLERRYPVDVPQCRELSYSWRPKRVMFLPGARALDVTIAFPRAVGPWPIELSDHETVFR